MTGLLAKARVEGPAGLARRAVRRLYDRIDAGSLAFPLLPGDIADSARLVDHGPAEPVSGRLTVGWLMPPPAAGSGGHTTAFRMVRALEEAGHRCVIVLYDRHHGDPAAQAAVIRAGWPDMRAEVRSVDAGMAGLDACIATSWESAHVLARRSTTRLHRLYFIQDYEPFFYPRGSLAELAADSYRFGFTNIALGPMVRDRLRSELGIGSSLVPFSCDVDVYRLRNTGPRSGIVAYLKPDVPRRGYLTSAMALAEFHERHPEHEIHVFGHPVPHLRVPVTRHPRLTPAELDALYNRCVAGLSLSFTNVSLVAGEMLASGCVPVVNDCADARAALDHPAVRWAMGTAGSLADALCAAVEEPADPATVASGIHADSWRETGAALVDIVERTCAGVTWEEGTPCISLTR